MKIPETLRTEKVQHIFQTALVIVLLIILPMLGQHMGKYGGGIAMLVASVFGLLAYFFLYGERLCSRGNLKVTMAVVVLSCSLGAAAPVTVWLIRSH
jgi:hypothetical protein